MVIRRTSSQELEEISRTKWKLTLFLTLILITLNHQIVYSKPHWDPYNIPIELKLLTIRKLSDT